jgi:hypothetical protein
MQFLFQGHRQSDIWSEPVEEKESLFLVSFSQSAVFYETYGQVFGLVFRIIGTTAGVGIFLL